MLLMNYIPTNGCFLHTGVGSGVRILETRDLSGNFAIFHVPNPLIEKLLKQRKQFKLTRFFIKS